MKAAACNIIHYLQDKDYIHDAKIAQNLMLATIALTSIKKLEMMKGHDVSDIYGEHDHESHMRSGKHAYA
jgi:hypothetical protein